MCTTRTAGRTSSFATSHPSAPCSCIRSKPTASAVRFISSALALTKMPTVSGPPLWAPRARRPCETCGQRAAPSTPSVAPATPSAYGGIAGSAHPAGRGRGAHRLDDGGTLRVGHLALGGREDHADKVGAALGRDDRRLWVAQPADLAERLRPRHRPRSSRMSAPGDAARMSDSPTRTPRAPTRASSAASARVATPESASSCTSLPAPIAAAPRRRPHVHLEGVQVAVVDADDLGARLEGDRAHLRLGVDLDEGLHAERAARRHQALQLGRLQDRHDEQRRVGAVRARLEQLVRVDHEVLAQHAHRRRAPPRRARGARAAMSSMRALEPADRAREHRDGARAGEGVRQPPAAPRRRRRRCRPCSATTASSRRAPRAPAPAAPPRLDAPGSAPRSAPAARPPTRRPSPRRRRGGAAPQFCRGSRGDPSSSGIICHGDRRSSETIYDDVELVRARVRVTKFISSASVQDAHTARRTAAKTSAQYRHVRQRRRRDGADPRPLPGHKVGARSAHAAGGAAVPRTRARAE